MKDHTITRPMPMHKSGGNNYTDDVYHPCGKAIAWFFITMFLII